VEPEGFIERLLEGEPWSGSNKKQQQHQKQNLLGKRKPVSWLRRTRVPQNQLDTADFLIDGLTHFAPPALPRRGSLMLVLLIG